MKQSCRRYTTAEGCRFAAKSALHTSQILDHEWESSKAEREKEREAELARRRSAEQAEKKKRQLERQLADEADAVRNDPKLAFWMKLAQASKTPPEMCLQGSSPVGIRAFVKVLGSCTSLRSLDLSRCRLRDDVGRYLAESLRASETIMSLNLSENSFTHITAQHLGSVLGSNSSLVSLNLSYNPLTNKGKDASGVSALAESLVSNTTLLHIGLAQTGLGRAGGEALVEALTANTTLRSVQLSHTDGLSVDQLAFITDRLQRNKEILAEQRQHARMQRAAQRQAEADALSAQAVADARSYAEDWLEARRLKREAQRVTADAAAEEAEKDEAIQREDRYKRWRALTANTGKKKGGKGKGKGKGKK